MTEITRKIQPSQLVFLIFAYVFGGLSLNRASIGSALFTLVLCVFAGFFASLGKCDGEGLHSLSVSLFPRGNVLFRSVLTALCAFPLITDTLSFSGSFTALYPDISFRVFFVILSVAAVFLSRYVRAFGRISELLPYLALLCAVFCLFGRFSFPTELFSGFNGISACGSFAVPLSIAAETVAGNENTTPALSARTGGGTSPRSRVVLSASAGAFTAVIFYFFVSLFVSRYGNTAQLLLVWMSVFLRLLSSVFAVRRLCEGTSAAPSVVLAVSLAAGFFAASKMPSDGLSRAALILNCLVPVFALVPFIIARVRVRQAV